MDSNLIAAMPPFSTSTNLHDEMFSREYDILSFHAGNLQFASFLTESAGYIVLRHLFIGVREHLLSLVVLYKLPEPEESRHIRNTRRLLHIMGDNYDRVLLLELDDQLFDPLGRYGV